MNLDTEDTDPLDRAIATVAAQRDLATLHLTAYDAIAEGSSGIVIAGCGQLGLWVLAGARNAGLKVHAFADNSAANWGRVIDGVPVMPLTQTLAVYAESSFVVAIYNSTPVRRQLAQLGCRRVVPYPMFYWRFAPDLPFEDRLSLPKDVLSQTELVRGGYELLADLASRDEFAAQIQWRCTLDYFRLPAARPPAQMYFDPELIALRDDEVLLDCGAYDGDSIRAFLAETGGRYRHIYAAEPDPKNRERLDGYLASLLGDASARITVLPYGLSDQAGVEFLEAVGTVGSRLAANGGEQAIECRRLDDLIVGPAPTFVKMDIEGAEPNAILGATETIRSARPIMAVCAYHRCEHLWTIPLLLHQALPDFRLFLRRYAEECWETVYYAIPPERLKAATT